MPRRRELLLTRRDRVILFALRAALAVSVVALVCFDAVAWAMALTPNAARTALATVPSPGELGARSVSSRLVPVGPTPATLAVWTVEPLAAQARGTVVLLHGIRMDRRSLLGIAAALGNAGYRTILLDLRGHGASSGRYLTYGRDEARDVSQVLDAVEAAGTRLGPVAVFGFSYGAAVALEASARDSRVSTVVAVSPFASLREVVRDYQANYLPPLLKWLPDSWFQAALDDAGQISRFDPNRAGPAFVLYRGTQPLLLLHGDADQQVPLRHSRQLLAAAGPRAELVTLPGATHDSVLSHPRVVTETLAWLESRLHER